MSRTLRSLISLLLWKSSWHWQLWRTLLLIASLILHLLLQTVLRHALRRTLLHRLLEWLWYLLLILLWRHLLLLIATWRRRLHSWSWNALVRVNLHATSRICESAIDLLLLLTR